MPAGWAVIDQRVARLHWDGVLDGERPAVRHRLGKPHDRVIGIGPGLRPFGAELCAFEHDVDLFRIRGLGLEEATRPPLPSGVKKMCATEMTCRLFTNSAPVPTEGVGRKQPT